MARIEDLIAEIGDLRLRGDVAAEVATLKKRRQFGLVYETHVPETVLLKNAAVRVGSIIASRRATADLMRVVAIDGDRITAEVLPKSDDAAGVTAAHGTPKRVEISAGEVLVQKRFGDPIFPTLTSVGEVRRGPDSRPTHTVINSENLFALELLALTNAGEVDCIYIDPPYNTGAKDWRYNNHYVDKVDQWRHSKWVAMMDHRLRIAAKLLKADGILVVAIDENEHAPLVLLLEEIFPGHAITSVAIVHNPRGVQGDNFSYTNEFAVFAVPKGQKVISRRNDDEARQDARPLQDSGGESMRTNARNCFYPILVQGMRIVGFGDVPESTFHPAGKNEEMPDGTIRIWPIDAQGNEKKWRYARQSVEAILDQLSVRNVKVKNGQPAKLDIDIAKDTLPYRTVWTSSRYDAAAYGTTLVADLTGDRFTFPKSLYNVRDVLHAATGNRPDALILDFFAGSGTTLHATCLLNAEDEGTRRCILVTNNEVESVRARALNKDGYYIGDAEYEKHGIFEAITKPRVTAAITGLWGTEPGKGEYLNDGGEMSAGFDENVEFFRLDFLDPDDVVLGLRLAELAPVFWLDAGAIGRRGPIDEGAAFVLPVDAPYAYLFRASGLRELVQQLQSRPDVTHVFVVTDSDEAYASLCQRLPRGIETSMHYRDYLSAFSGTWGGE